MSDHTDFWSAIVGSVLAGLILGAGLGAVCRGNEDDKRMDAACVKMLASAAPSDSLSVLREFPKCRDVALKVKP